MWFFISSLLKDKKSSLIRALISLFIIITIFALPNFISGYITLNKGFMLLNSGFYLVIILLTYYMSGEQSLTAYIISTYLPTIIFVSIVFIPLTNDISSFLNGFGLHFAIVLFQLYILFNKKVAISKKALVWSFLLYLIFISSYDSFARINAAIGMSKDLPEIQLVVIIFYLLAISTLVNYLYKKKYGILLP